jgi:hypothetical protein
MYKTKVINLYGGPGTGKSTVAAGAFHDFKTNKIRCELVREFVKDWAYDGKKIERRHQIKLFAEQADREGCVYGKVEWVVTDSPLILCEIYEKRYFGEATMTAGLYERWLELNKDVIEPIHIKIVRTKEYDAVGRYETEEQAKEMDALITERVEELCLKTNQILHIVNYETAIEEIKKICLGTHLKES